MLEHTAHTEIRLVGTMWNIAFDAGVSLGGALLGAVAARAGYGGVLISLPLLTVVALVIFATAWNGPRPEALSTRS
jgi:predicted MFS family arabinose efflux permease